MDEDIGLGGYQGGESAQRPGPRQIFAMLVRKTQLRALLEIESARIAEALPSLTAAETEQLSEMLRGEVADCNADVASLAEQVDREAALAASTKAMDLKLSRSASKTLQAKMMRRIERSGFCPAPATLAADAIARAYRGRS
jgi:hypothetical protein